MSRESGEEDLGAAGYTAATTQLALCLRLSLLKGESWLRAATLDDSKKPQLQSYTIQVWLYETFIVFASSSSG
jgi:hypothetical protein